MNKFIMLLLAACLSAPVIAQDNDMQSLPGYVNFGELEEFYGEPRVMININGFLLKFMSAAAAASKNDQEAALLMRNLDGVRVNVYDTVGKLEPAKEQIATVKKVLQKAGWQPVVQVKKTDEEVQIFMKGDDGGMQGLTVMTVNTEEAVFINILGEIDPTQLNAVMAQLNVDVDVETE
ncbi:MAG: DUF4252 domain-containing protein [Halieaceae bacterium]